MCWSSIELKTPTKSIKALPGENINREKRKFVFECDIKNVKAARAFSLMKTKLIQKRYLTENLLSSIFKRREFKKSFKFIISQENFDQIFKWFFFFSSSLPISVVPPPASWALTASFASDSMKTFEAADELCKAFRYALPFVINVLAPGLNFSRIFWNKGRRISV